MSLTEDQLLAQRTADGLEATLQPLLPLQPHVFSEDLSPDGRATLIVLTLSSELFTEFHHPKDPVARRRNRM